MVAMSGFALVWQGCYANGPLASSVYSMDSQAMTGRSSQYDECELIDQRCCQAICSDISGQSFIHIAFGHFNDEFQLPALFCKCGSLSSDETSNGISETSCLEAPAELQANVYQISVTTTPTPQMVSTSVRANEVDPDGFRVFTSCSNGCACSESALAGAHMQSLQVPNLEACKAQCTDATTDHGRCRGIEYTERSSAASRPCRSWNGGGSGMDIIVASLGSASDCYGYCEIGTECSVTRVTGIEADEEEEEEEEDMIIYYVISGVAVVTIGLCVFAFVFLRSAKAESSHSTVDLAGEEDHDFALPPMEVVKGYPSYWAGKAREHVVGFRQNYYVSSEHHPVFDKLLKNSYHNKATQDRRCPFKKPDHAKHRGGCACVQPGGSPGLPTGYRVRRVIRVEDSEQWSRYFNKRKQLIERRGGDATDPSHPIEGGNGLLTAVTGEDENSHIFDPQDKQMNEIYLWHGTSARHAISIAQEDFRIKDFAGASTGGTSMYGDGTYMAESITKADEYAADPEENSFYHDIYAVLLCRVTLGKFYYTTERDQGARDKCAKGEFDSTMGDRLTAAKTYREFVVYENDQVYPEYIVLYQRHMSDDSDEKIDELCRRPFPIELPIYWRNCPRNPRETFFNMQYLVRKAVISELEKIVNASLTDKSNLVRLIQVRRIEKAELWNRYIDFQQDLRKHREETVYLSVKDHVSGEDHHEIKAKALELFGSMEDSSKVHAEEILSVERLDDKINERLVYFATTRKFANDIQSKDFEISRDTASAKGVGARDTQPKLFGSGAYFYDSFDGALKHAKLEDGLRYVIICRIVLGDMLCVTTTDQPDASNAATLAGKHSVFGSVSGSPSEFVISNNAQVYPEYVLAIKRQR